MLAKTRDELIWLRGSPDQVQAFLTARLVNDKLPTSVTYECLLGAWNQICNWCIPPSLTSLKALVNWIKARSRRSGSRGTALRIRLAALVYFLWKARNDVLWNNVPFNSASFIRQVKIHVYATMISHYPHAASFAMI
ncbi:hypothetical protein Dimus_011667 [Dionaea muscipula]